MPWGQLAAIALLVVVAAAVGAGVAAFVLRGAASQRTPGPSIAPPPPPPAAPLPPTGPDHDAFVTIVAHDLRAPIRVVEGFTRIVKEDYAGVLDKVGLDHLERVLGAATRMNHMIDAMLALSRLSTRPLARVPVNLSQLAGFVVDELRRLEPGRTVDVEIEPDLLAAGDPTLLRLVLENLLGNAWKYTGNAAAARIGFVRGEGDDAFVVHDNGAGFDMRYAERLFSIFQRLHSASEFPGSGVGLASVRRVVERHGGEIRAEAEPEKGARFTFTLPAAGAASPG